MALTYDSDTAELTFFIFELIFLSLHRYKAQTLTKTRYFQKFDYGNFFLLK